MLKVVGASWHKTRISTYILMGAGFLAIGAFFLAEMERPQLNGGYCATIFWTEKTGFQVEYWKQRDDYENIPKGVARIWYKDLIIENGWSQLELETQRNYPDWVQAFGAGVLEGTLSWRNIYNQWSNTIGYSCDQDEESQNFCTWLRDTLDTNYGQMKKMAEQHADHDHYWHQIRLFYYQLEGLEAGWIRGAKRARSGLEDSIPFVDFLLMNSAADIQDLKIYYERNIIRDQKSTLNRNFINSRATMLLKLFKNENFEWKLVMGHSAAGSYSSMLRVHKHYKFRYHFSPNHPKSHDIPGTDISFTGYPGILASTDDFYFVRGRQVNTVISGVAVQYNNNDLFDGINLENMMPLAARVMAANRLALNRRTWEKVMSRHLTSGSKQWLQIDLKKLNRLQSQTQQIPSGLIWLAEQLPGRFIANDVTSDISMINGTNYILNGIPYFEEFLIASGLTKSNLNVSHLIDEVKNLENVDTYLRKLAFRGDLLGEQSMPYGNIDMKLFKYEPIDEISKFQAISGPLFTTPRKLENSVNIMSSESLTLSNSDESEVRATTQSRSVRNDIQAIAMQKLHQQVPFRWSNMEGNFKNVRHNGHPDEWNFEKVSPTWAWIN